MGISFLRDLPYVNLEMINELPNYSVIISSKISKNKDVKEITGISSRYCNEWKNNKENMIIVKDKENELLAFCRIKVKDNIYCVLLYLSEL